MTTFSPGDRVVVESPVFFVGRRTHEHADFPGANRPKVGDILTVTEAHTGAVYVDTPDGGYALPVAAIILDTETEHARLETERGPRVFSKGDRVIVESPVYTEGAFNTDGLSVGMAGEVIHGPDEDGDYFVDFNGGDALYVLGDGLLPEPAPSPVEPAPAWDLARLWVPEPEPAVDLDAVHLTADDARRAQSLSAAKAILNDDADVFDLIRVARFIIGGKR